MFHICRYAYVHVCIYIYLCVYIRIYCPTFRIYSQNLCTCIFKCKCVHILSLTRSHIFAGKALKAAAGIEADSDTENTNKSVEAQKNSGKEKGSKDVPPPPPPVEFAAAESGDVVGAGSKRTGEVNGDAASAASKKSKVFV